MIYGWGTKTKDWTMPDGRQLVCRYNYVSLMFILKLVWRRQWLLITRDRAMDTETDRAELEQIYGPGNVPDIGLFERFGAFMVIGSIVAVASVVGIVQSLGGTGTVEAGPGIEASGAVAEVVESPGDEGDDPTIDDTDDAGEDDQDEGQAGDDDEDEDGTSIGSAAAPGDDTTSDDSDDDPAGDAGDDDTTDGATDGALFQEATDITSVGSSTFASTNLASPLQGWSATSVDRVTATTGELDGQLPDAGQKFVVVDYELVGQGATANVLDPAFRLIADDQQYGPIGPTINYTLAGGEVANSAMYFSVPIDATSFRMEMGIVDAAADGFQSAYEFTLTDTDRPADPERYDGPDLSGSATQTSSSNLMTGTPRNVNPNFEPLRVEVTGATITSKVGADGATPGFRFLVL
ncbi:MAG: hypothetical protein AAFO29_03785, partial [Actinomycetota bacterium]